MPDQSSVNFGEAWNAYGKDADAYPEWFDRANDTLESARDGKMLMAHAILIALKAAYEAGQAGKGLPPIKSASVQSLAKYRRNHATEWRTGPDVEPPAPPPRVRRSPPAAPEPAAKPVQRVMRRPAPAVKQDEYLEGIINRVKRLPSR